MSFPMMERTNPASPSFRYPDHLKSVKPASILEDVFWLLEDYGPAWYTEDLHDRLVDALQVHSS